MEKILYETFIANHTKEIENIRQAAWALHESVNQTYGDTLPYGYHLSMVADAAIKYGAEVIRCEEDILSVIFGAYYHDSIEDARLTYNDVKKIAYNYLNENQVLTAAEIVYALTNDKGRTRAERAGEHYYAGIRTTPYAPFVKLCDRYANMEHSFKDTHSSKHPMREVYRKEWPHFIEAIQAESSDPRYSLPKALMETVNEWLH